MGRKKLYNHLHIGSTFPSLLIESRRCNKPYLSTTTERIKTKLSTKHPWAKKIQVKDHTVSQGEIVQMKDHMSFSVRRYVSLKERICKIINLLDLVSHVSDVVHYWV